MDLSIASRVCRLAPIATTVMLVLIANPVAAEDFYVGKTIDLIVANPPGGGYDQYARLVARHLGRHIPGSPSVIVQNMPGAGGVRAANYLFNVARRDGTTVSLFTRETPMGPLLEGNRSSYQFEVNDFNWIGSPQQELGLLIVSTKAPATTIEELKLRSIAVSGTGLGTAPSVFPRVLNEVIGTKFRVVEGYPGSQEALLALEKGEVDGHASGGSSAAFRGRINPWIAKGEAKVLLQLGMKKDDAYPSAPLAFDLVQSGLDRQFLELEFTAEVLGRPLVAPPGIPPERLALLRAAFDAAMKDPQLLAEAGRMQLDINPVTGAEIAAVLKKAYALPTSQIERARSVATRR